uniref:Uncharacterized protein n=1 Tax=Amphimedon queenslandica TaxID=400682 RepID=A0A1X7VTH0_AMPQE
MDLPVIWKAAVLCAEVKGANLLLPLLSKVSWADLKTCDVPSDIPFEIKGAATSLKSLIVNRSDNSSAKAFTRVLLEFIKTYSLCVPHATHCDVPKSQHDLGEFEVYIFQQQKIPQPLFDSCSSSDHSRSPKRARSWTKCSVPEVNYEELESSSDKTDETLDTDEDDGKM